MTSRVLRALPYGVLAVLGSFLYSVAARIEYQERAGTLGPDVWPKALLALLIIVCLYQAGRILLFGHGGAEGAAERLMEPPAPGEPEAAPAPAPVAHPGMLLGGMALTVLYVGVIETLGFFLATVPYIALFIVIGGYRRWPVVAALSLGGTLILLFLFMKVVYVSLPPGTGPFAEVTFFLMKLLGIR